MHVRIFDHLEKAKYVMIFPSVTLVKCFGHWNWEFHDRVDFKFLNLETNETVAVVRRQYSNLVKEKCSNGGHTFIKFK